MHAVGGSGVGWVLTRGLFGFNRSPGPHAWSRLFASLVWSGIGRDVSPISLSVSHLSSRTSLHAPANRLRFPLGYLMSAPSKNSKQGRSFVVSESGPTGGSCYLRTRPGRSTRSLSGLDPLSLSTSGSHPGEVCSRSGRSVALLVSRWPFAGWKRCPATTTRTLRLSSNNTSPILQINR